MRTMNKRILSALTVLCLVLTLLPVTALASGGAANRGNFVTDFQEFDHSSGWTPVSSPEDLSNIRNDLSGNYYLTGDIDLSGYENWEPIGTQSAPFTGMLDGCGYVIRNLTIAGRNGRSDFGLFGAVKNAQIVDLGLENVDIDVDSDTQGSRTISNVGGLIGYAANSSGSAVIVMNCYVTGDISFNSSGELYGYAGGLIGRTSLTRYSSYYGASALVSASYNRANITASGYSCGIYAGGLVGYVGGSDESSRLGVQYAFNTGNVTTYAFLETSNAGGLIASNNANTSVYSCYNSGNLFATGGQGLGGYDRSSYVAGGLVADNNATLMLSESYNYGDVEAANSESTNDCDVIAGGLLGEGTYETGVDNCYNAGDVSAEGNYGAARAGGLAGLIHAIGEDYNLRQGAYFTDSFILASSVAVWGRADVSQAALVYTTDAEEGKWVDNGIGNVWQDGTKDTVTKNTAIAADDIAGGAEDNAKGGKITRSDAKELSTYTQKGWNEGDIFWMAVPDCAYPQLFFQTETLGYTGGIVRGVLGGSAAILEENPRLGDTLHVNTDGLTVTPSEAEMGELSYQWTRNGTAISDATGDTYLTTAQDVGQALGVTVTAANCSGSVTAPAVTVGKGTYTGTAELTQSIRVGAPGTVTVDLRGLVPDAANPVYTYEGKTDEDNMLGEPAVSGYTLTVPYHQVEAAEKTATISLTITSDTYEPITATVILRSVSKEALPADALVCQDAAVTYNGQSQAIGQASVSGDFTGGAFTYTYRYTAEGYDSTTPPVNAGTYTVTVTAENDDYLGTATATFTIAPKPLTDAMLTVAAATYSGKSQTPVLTVTDGETSLKEGTDYLSQTPAQKDAGTYPVEIAGTGNYTGSAQASFVIDPKDISGALITLAQDGFVYTGKPVEPKISAVSADGVSLTEEDYTVSYQNNVEVGTATVTVTAKEGGNFTGSATKEFSIIESEFYFSVSAPATMVVGQKAEAATTLAGVETAQTYDHALILVDVTGPEGSAPQVLATDTEGHSFNLAETKQWGPDSGFQVKASYSATTPLSLSFDKAGTYTAAFTLVDLDNEKQVLGSGSFTVTVEDAYTFTLEAPDSMRPETKAEAKVTLTGDANAPTYDHALILVEVTGPEGSKPQVLATDTQGNTFNLAETKQWGPDGGFQVKASYSATTPLSLSFDKTGTYTATFTLVDLDQDNRVLGSGEKTIQVRTPSSGGGSATSYVITVESSQHGSVSSSRVRATSGTTVTLTVTPDEGYGLDTLTVKDQKGNDVKLTRQGAGKYTFTMPSSQVRVNATFTQEAEESTLPFADVAVSDWFYDAVAYVYEKEIMSGTSTTRFSPDTPLTRAQICQVLYNLEKATAVSQSAFSDVAEDAWYADAVNWAAAKHLVQGYGNGKFGPEDIVTREQMAQILYNYAKMKGYDLSPKGDITLFPDAQAVSDWAKEAVTWAVGSGLLGGRTSGVLDPTGTATRAEVAQILWNFCEKVVK